MKEVFLLAISCLLSAVVCPAQSSDDRTADAELVWADSMIASYAEDQIKVDYNTTIGEMKQVYAVYAERADTCMMAYLLGAMCNTYDKGGKLDIAVVTCQKALKLYRSYCDSLRLMSITVHLSNVYLSLGDIDKALSICEEALDGWNPSWGFTISKDGLYTNRAIALAYLGRTEESLEAFRDVLRNAQEQHDHRLIRAAYANLGSIFGMLSGGVKQDMLDSAEHYIFKTLNLVRTIDPLGSGMMMQYSNVASMKYDRGKFREALIYLDSSQTIAERLGDLQAQVIQAYSRSRSFRQLGDHTSALAELETYVSLKDSLLGTEKVKAIADMQEKYESEKKAGEIRELKIQNLDSLLKEEKATRSRNIILFSGIGVFILALGLWNRLLFTRKSRAAIEKEKEISESLLLNILPAETAKELKEKGHADAQLIDHVTVLFTDFKGFTAMSEQVTPKELVADLHECFSLFDNICEKHGTEKIKTIGDAYMAAGGLPTPNTTHAVDAVKAALEMAEVVEQGKARKIEQGLPYFEIRIGIHTGPVVAGIVGIKKFQYDIWGDTVNTASRMESSGEVGRVNISEATYALVKDDFVCEFRGEIEAKGKGKLGMYFVSLKSA
jgi:adenylate cyclase